MRRFSIRTLMGLVFAIAVAFAALRGANHWWAGGFVLAALGLFGYSILAAVHGQGRARAAWLGFLVLGGGYFLAIRALPTQEVGWLPTSQFLAYAETQVVGANAITVNFTPTGLVTTTATSMTRSPSPPGTPASGGTVDGDLFVFTGPTVTNNTVGLRNTITTPGPPWAAILPGAANGDAFKCVGHGLFALFFGFVGAMISRRMYHR